MAIQMRRGLKRDFDPSKMLPGEWAVSIDADTHNQIVWMCFAPGIVKRMGTYEDFKSQIAEAAEEIINEYQLTFDEIKEYMEELEKTTKGYKEAASASAASASGSANTASQKAASASQSSSAAKTSADQSEDFSLLSQSYAVGTENTVRENDKTDNAKNYYEQCKSISESLSGALKPMGTVAFTNLPALSDASAGDMYNISDQFTTTADFNEGSGHIIPAGANVYKTADGKWDVLAGTPVTSVNGKKGNVEITPDNIGAYSKDYSDSHFAPGGRLYHAFAAKGWYRIAKAYTGVLVSAQGALNYSCTLSVKKDYGYSQPEYHEVQLISQWKKSKIVDICDASSNTENQIITAVRHTVDETNKTTYLEIYYNSNNNNPINLTLMDNLHFEMIRPELTQETVSGVEVYSKLDLPVNFDIGDLMTKRVPIAHPTDIEGSSSVPVSACIETGYETVKDLVKYRSLIGTVKEDSSIVYWNMISVRHRNGYENGTDQGDGNQYGMYLKSLLTSVDDDLSWGRQYGKDKWQPERTILDSANFSNYALSKAGNAVSATKATQDGSGNNIVNTYARKSIYGDDAVRMGIRAGNPIGINSISVGYDCCAGGDYSASLGTHGGDAIGDYSAVIGSIACQANHENSVVIGGVGSQTNGECAVAQGIGNNAGNCASVITGKYSRGTTSVGSVINQLGDAFVIGNGTGNSARSNALRVTFNGEIRGTQSFQSSGADYAEFIKPWADGNPDTEDRVGYFVTIRDGCLYKAEPGDYIAGITSGNPSIVGNADEDYYWRYERDEFNRIVMEDAPEIVQKTERKALMQEVHKKNEDGQPLYDESGDPVYEEIPVLDENGIQIYKEVPVYDENHRPVMVETGKIIKNACMKLAENYDPSLQENYTERKYRPEWDYVGMLGVLPVRDDGTCLSGHYCKCGLGGIATLAEERGFDTYMVIERIAKNVVSVILR